MVLDCVCVCTRVHALALATAGGWEAGKVQNGGVLFFFFFLLHLPSTSTTGSVITSNPIGQKNDGGAVCKSGMISWTADVIATTSYGDGAVTSKISTV